MTLLFRGLKVNLLISAELPAVMILVLPSFLVLALQPPHQPLVSLTVFVFVSTGGGQRLSGEGEDVE